MAREFDGAELRELEVSTEQKARALRAASPEFLRALRTASRNLQVVHRRQRPQSYTIAVVEGVRVGLRWKPLQRVGIYAPGGRAAYPSSVLMAAIPARVAGVRELILCSPPRSDGGVHPAILVAAEVAGIRRVFAVGGAQAIAAMAFGTATIPAVEKIVGPGNIYVTAAKAELASTVGIDFLAGPSEIVILADHTADAEAVASDLIAQAEHDPEAWAILVADSSGLLETVQVELERQTENLPTAKTIRAALQRHGRLLRARSRSEMIAFANAFAPEHLLLMIGKPAGALRAIHNAGSVFLGRWAPVTLGDYCAGSNHILPTLGQARFRGGLTTLDFLKPIYVQWATRPGLRKLGPTAKTLAEEEGLPAHGAAVEVRLRRGGAGP